MRPSKTSGATTVQDARTALGKRLRELRRQAKMTGEQLAEALSWSPSKISKLENARQTPTDDDIRGWTEATGTVHEADALLTALHNLELQHAEWQHQLRPGLRPHQTELGELDTRTQLFRVFEPSTIPGLLQTAEYARARFTEGTVLFQTPNDVDHAVQARMQRQELLYRRDKRFHFVLTEAALRYRRCDSHALLAQLDRLMSLSALPNVKFGVISNETKYVIGPWHAFWLRDRERVTIETYSAELNLAQPQEIELYARVFESLATIAKYGRDARAIVTRVIDDLTDEAAPGNL